MSNNVVPALMHAFCGKIILQYQLLTGFCPLFGIKNRDKATTNLRSTSESNNVVTAFIHVFCGKIPLPCKPNNEYPGCQPIRVVAPHPLRTKNVPFEGVFPKSRAILMTHKWGSVGRGRRRGGGEPRSYWLATWV